MMPAARMMKVNSRSGRTYLSFMRCWLLSAAYGVALIVRHSKCRSRRRISESALLGTDYGIRPTRQVGRVTSLVESPWRKIDVFAQLPYYARKKSRWRNFRNMPSKFRKAPFGGKTGGHMVVSCPLCRISQMSERQRDSLHPHPLPQKRTGDTERFRYTKLYGGQAQDRAPPLLVRAARAFDAVAKGPHSFLFDEERQADRTTTGRREVSATADSSRGDVRRIAPQSNGRAPRCRPPVDSRIGVFPCNPAAIAAGTVES